MVNMVTIVGNLGKDPEVRFLPSGQAVCNFSVATSRSWKDKDGNKKEETEWFSVEVFGKQAESCGKYLAKGRQVFVNGRQKTDSWEKDGQRHYKTKLIADDVKFLGGKGEGGAKPATDDSDTPF
jgi:single-strand DNA-binding protein